MANEYFEAGNVPAQNSPGYSTLMRQEFSQLVAAFDKLPIMAGHENEFIIVNGTGTSLITSGIDSSTFVTVSGVQTLTNKTLSWSDNSFVGFGSAATKNAGTNADNVLLLAENNKLPVIDGSNLTNVASATNVTGVVAIENGGTGANSLAGAKTALGIDLKANANNATLTGAPVAPTPPTGNNSVRIATTEFVNNTVTAIGAFAPSSDVPLVDGVASAGISALGSRADHVHPRDTTKADLNSPVFTGDPRAPTPATSDNDTSIATTAFVVNKLAGYTGVSVSSALPLVNGTASAGVSADASRADHVHPVDPSIASGLALKANLASPVFTGDPKAPTPATSDNDTSIATTAFVQALVAQQTVGALASDATPLMNGVADKGFGVETSRYDHVHPTDTSRAASGANSDITSLTACTQITAASVTVATDDKILIKDTSDSDLLKSVTAQSIADLPVASDAKLSGYSSGAGGSVTQATSKSTQVVLHKPTGKITMHNGALLANTSVTFAILNNKVTNQSVVALSVTGGISSTNNYIFQTYTSSGAIQVMVRNISVGSLSEAIEFMFVVIGGSTS